MLKWLTESFDSVLLSGLRVTAACTLLIGMVVRTRRWPRLAPGQWYTLLACGALITAPTPLAIAACALLGERPNLGRLVAVAAVLCGVAVGVLQRPGAELARGGLGDLIVIGGMLAFTAGVALLQRLAATVDAVVISPSIHAIGAIGLLLHAGIVTLMLVHAPRCADSVAPWVGLVLSGAFFTGIGNLLWNHGVRLIGVTRASVWLYWVPLSGVAAAVLLLGDPLMRWHLLGLALVLGGTWLGTRRAVVAVAPFEV